MAQGDYLIQNQSFPSFRSDLNSTLEAINTSNSGTSRPSSAVAGTVWLDTTNATNPTLKFFDGTDDISLAQLDYTANTVNWLDSTVVADLVNDTTPQLGGDLDVNGNDIVSTSNGNITFTPDGTGKVIIDGLSHPTADGTSGQNLITDGAGNLSFSDVTPADNTVSLAKLTATGTKDATTFLRGDNTFAEAGGGGMVLLTSADITTTTSSITISSTYINDTYEHYQLWIRGKDAGDGPQFFMRFRNNADDATISSGYAYRVGSIADNGSGTNSDSATAIVLSQDNMGNAANEGFNMTLDFMSSRSALVPTSVHYNINLADTSGAFQANHGMGRLNDATVQNSGFVLFYGNGGDFAAGTNYEFYGMKK